LDRSAFIDSNDSIWFEGDKMKTLLSTFVSILFITLVFSTQVARAQEDVGRLLKELEESSDRFSKSLNQALDRSKFNGTSSEDEINGYVKTYEDSTDRLKKNHDKGQDMRVSTQEVVQHARTIDKFLKKNPMDATVKTDWNTVKAQLRRVARAQKVKSL
jgi:hypothetical protein